MTQGCFRTCFYGLPLLMAMGGGDDGGEGEGGGAGKGFRPAAYTARIEWPHFSAKKIRRSLSQKSRVRECQ